MLIFNTLVMLLLMHVLADYPLQGDFMAKAKNHKLPIAGVPFYENRARKPTLFRRWMKASQKFKLLDKSCDFQLSRNLNANIKALGLQCLGNLEANAL